MLQGLAKSICVNAKKTAADNTPAAVNWGNVSAVARKGGGTNYTYSAQQITGISTSITLRVVFTDIAATIWYKIQNTGTLPVSGAPANNNYNSAAHNSTITVSNNEYLVFGTNGGSWTVTVNNTSDSNATLDTFTSSGAG